MTNGEISDLVYKVFVSALQLGGPLLIISMAVGIVIAILQAATQIHEQTLTFVPKLVTIGVVLILTGQNMLVSLQEFFREIFALVAAN